MATEEEVPFLDTLHGEISFFRSTMKSRPVGIHRHFHVLAIRQAIKQDTGTLVSAEAIWDKLSNSWNLDALELLEGVDSDDSSTPAPAIRSPSPSENLDNHPFFVSEFALPYAEFDQLMSARRLREAGDQSSTDGEQTTALPSRPPQKPKKSRKSSTSMAGLLGGDSDSSALTESEEDNAKVTSAASPTEEEEEEDEEYNQGSPRANKRRKSTAGMITKKKSAPKPKSTKPATKKKKSGK